MEKKCKIVCLGDSITRGYFPYFKDAMEERYPDGRFELINFGQNGHTAEDGRQHVERVVDLAPDVAIVGYGTNDALQEVEPQDFRTHLMAIVQALEEKEVRVILNNLHPICDTQNNREDKRTRPYNEMIRETAGRFTMVENDIYRHWKASFPAIKEGLIYEGCDFIHPNYKGHRLIADRLVKLAPRHMTRIVWQFNGADAYCNYRCPYCYQPPEFHSSHHFKYDTGIWRDRFRQTFRNRHLNFYLSFGEPMAAGAFDAVIHMIASEPRWKTVVLTNLSQDIRPLMEKQIVKEGRLFLVASFHPTMTDPEPFIDKILTAREHGVEVPVVYVMWPPQIDKFANRYFDMFQKHRILVHVRRFRGVFKNRSYPQNYSWEEIKLMGRYMDDFTIKYMLCDRISSGRESFAGMSYLGVGNNGDMWVCPDWAGDRLKMGNVIDGTAQPNTGPMVLGGRFSDGTTDGIANLLETDMDELSDNHILSYCRQVGFNFDGDRIHYPNFNTDFDDPDVRMRLGLEELYQEKKQETASSRDGIACRQRMN